MGAYLKQIAILGVFLLSDVFVAYPAALAGGSIAQTSFVCRGRLRHHYFEVRVNDELDDRITLWSSVHLKKHSFYILSDYWDASNTGLISAIDCFITYENHDGCIRNVKITGNFLGPVETVGFESCGGYHQGCR